MVRFLKEIIFFDYLVKQLLNFSTVTRRRKWNVTEKVTKKEMSVPSAN
jgi:hypothetical protein